MTETPAERAKRLKRETKALFLRKAADAAKSGKAEAAALLDLAQEAMRELEVRRRKTETQARYQARRDKARTERLRRVARTLSRIRRERRINNKPGEWGDPVTRTWEPFTLPYDGETLAAIARKYGHPEGLCPECARLQENKSIMFTTREGIIYPDSCYIKTACHVLQMPGGYDAHSITEIKAEKIGQSLPVTSLRFRQSPPGLVFPRVVCRDCHNGQRSRKHTETHPRAEAAHLDEAIALKEHSAQCLAELDALDCWTLTECNT